MINVQFENVQTILCLGSHADDIEIGCGGTLLKLLEQNPKINVVWVVLSGAGERAEEARRSAEKFLANAQDSKIVIKEFRDSFFPYCGEEIKEFFFELQQEVSPDVIFTHRREDMHQDHRVVAELTWNTFRNHLILEYEIPKYEGDLGNPNVFVPLTKDMCEQKIDAIIHNFKSQQSKPWFCENTFWSLLRIRGIECCSPSQFAEGLYCRKMTI
ncbi:MAG: PIG-L domain-containing protein [Blastopirellula sp.]|nr:MAG: PIG-L domain-containing protein [Blastopirellula sp.]